MRPSDPALYPPDPGETAPAIYVVSFGYHSGLVLRRDDIVLAAATGTAPVGISCRPISVTSKLDIPAPRPHIEHDDSLFVPVEPLLSRFSSGKTPSR